MSDPRGNAGAALLGRRPDDLETTISLCAAAGRHPAPLSLSLSLCV